MRPRPRPERVTPRPKFFFEADDDDDDDVIISAVARQVWTIFETVCYATV